MKKYLMIAAGLVLAPTLAMAAPDLNGTWVRDAQKSDPSSFPVYWMPRNPPATGGGFGGPTEIVLKQSASSLQITDPARALRDLPLDGKPHVVTAETGMVKQTVTAAAQGDSVVVTTVLPYAGMPGGVVTNVKETWSVSPDGKALTVSTVRSTPAADQASKTVYNRK